METLQPDGPLSCMVILSVSFQDSLFEERRRAPPGRVSLNRLCRGPNPDKPVGAKRKSRFSGELKIEN